MAKQGRLSRFLFGSYEEAPAATPAEEELEDAVDAVPTSDTDPIDVSEKENSETDGVTDVPELVAEEGATSSDMSETVDEGVDEDALDTVVETEDEPKDEAVGSGIAEVTIAEETSDQVAAEPEKKLSWFERLKQGLSRSSGALGEGISAIFTKRKLDDDTIQDLEDIFRLTLGWKPRWRLRIALPMAATTRKSAMMKSRPFLLMKWTLF